MSEDPNSLGYHFENGDSIWAVCENPKCNRPSANLDLQLLVNKLGPDFIALHHTLTPKLKCSACGSKRISLRLIPFSTSKMG